MNTLTENRARLPFVLIAAAFGLLLGSAVTPAAAQEPVLGTWEWDSTRESFVLQADGSASQGTLTGQWTCLNPNANPRVYQINWNKGLILDTLYLTNGGTQLTGQNQTSYNLLAHRAATPAPAAASDLEGYVYQVSEQFPLAMDWVLTPLDQPLPTAVRESINAMDAGLRAEAASVPQTSLGFYRQSWSLWQAVRAALLERDAMLARNYELGQGGIVETWRNAWAERARILHASFTPSFAQFHDALRLNPRFAAFRADHAFHADRGFGIPNASASLAFGGHAEAARPHRDFAPVAHNPAPIAQGPFEPHHLVETGHAHGSNHGVHHSAPARGHGRRR